MPRALPFVTLLALPACGAGEDSFGGDATASTDYAGTDAPPADTGPQSTVEPTEPDADWYALDGQLELVAGEIVLGPTTSLRATLLDAELAVVCEHEVGILSADAATPPPDEPATLGWWELSLLDGAPDREPCPAWAARPLRLGVGPYDPRLDPALAAQQTPTDPTPYGAALYGLYVQERDGAPLWVVGVVTMPGLRQRDLVSAPPLPDGIYEVHSLLLLAFTDP